MFRTEYKHAEGQHKADVVWLISKIAHPISLPYVKTFLADKEVCGWGVNLLDQLLWQNQISPEEAEPLTAIAESHYSPQIRDQAKFIRDYLKEKNS